ncbi:MAG: GFA family protein, partial [bacterium]|nr:GFA family protein [bacterium]
GAPFVAWATFPTAGLQVTCGQLAQYPSSERVLRGFCASCGTGISYRNLDRSEEIDVAVAVLDNPGLLEPEYHIWVSHKLSWVDLGDRMPQFAEWRTSRVEHPA